MATAQTLVEREEEIEIQKDCKISAKINGIKWPRNKSLSNSDLRLIKNCINPKIVITGSVSKIQLQLSKLFKKSGSKVFPYNDSFSPIDSKSIVFKFTDLNSTFLVASNEVRDSILKISNQLSVKVIGQSSILKWKKTIKQEEKNNLKKSLKITKPVILFVGSYGKGYREIFKQFSNITKSFKQFQILLSLHPKMDGKLEREILEMTDNQVIQIVDKKISTAKVSLISDIIIPYRSTVGIQAFFIPKPVIYLDHPTSKYSNFAIDKGWVKKISSVELSESFLKAHRQLKKAKSDIYQKTGIPQNPITLFLDFIDNVKIKD